MLRLENIKSMKPLIISYSDLMGGASRASWRLHRSFIESDIDSSMRVALKKSDDYRVFGPIGKIRKGVVIVRPLLNKLITSLQKNTDTILHSSAVFPSRIDKDINLSNADVVNLHWVNCETLSIEAIGRINKPVIWTLHDMWAFCGTEHYVKDKEDARFKFGYRKDNCPTENKGIDIDRWVWSRKKRAWSNPITIISPSNWLAECAQQSMLMRDWPIYVVPNPIDTNIYRPHEKGWCRDVLGLPKEVPLILFGAIGGSKDPRKGFDLLIDALNKLRESVHLRDAHCVIFGQGKPEMEPPLGYPIHWMGHLHDDPTLALLYNAADVVVVPSRQENLPQSGTEAHACGTPVVAFNVTGLVDIVRHKETGFLAKPFDTSDLANGIIWVLDNKERYISLSREARSRATRNWSQKIIAQKYLSIFEKLIEKYK